MVALNNKAFRQIFTYHEATKHYFRAFAPGPGHLDWDTQPNPFRRYIGAAVLPLSHPSPQEGPPYEVGFRAGLLDPAPLDQYSLSRLFYDSLALSAWKQAGAARWALRVNPSSGNLHPTEGYVICGPVGGLMKTPMVAHYAPQEHALEVRATIPATLWESLSADLPAGTILVGLTSIHWREAWKYGERAYRYCQLDVGHALAALSIAAAGMGWQTALLDDLSTDQVATLLGTTDLNDIEAEHPDCLMAIYPQGETSHLSRLPKDAVSEFSSLQWLGAPNQLSNGHVEWELIAEMAEATQKPQTAPIQDDQPPAAAAQKRPVVATPLPPLSDGAGAGLRPIIHQRRSAVAMDGSIWIGRDTLFRILRRTMPQSDRLSKTQGDRFPFSMLPWRPRVHLVLFLHRVRDVEPGLYCLARAPGAVEELRDALKPSFVWDKPPGCPPDLPFYHLLTGNARSAAQQLACTQDIAGDGCFSLSMLAEFEAPLAEVGPWVYPRLFWECGQIGQVLYLEAEAAGLRGAGIGCFFDDPVHELLGVRPMTYQSLYHFTVGGPVEDPRLVTLPAYQGGRE